MSAPTSAAADPQLPAHLISLTIGYVLLQVFSTNFVQWPPNAYVSPEMLDKTANWGQPTEQAI